MKRSQPSARSAFTLVELLVVIGIISLLAAIVTPAVMRAQASAKNAAIKAEIDMLHMAIMNYKNEYGSFPPCSDDLTSSTGFATKHLQRLFPRCADPYSQLTNVLAGKSPAAVSPSNALAFWLSGYTNNPSLPLWGSTATRSKLYDFDASRLDPTTGAYWPSGKSKSPYVYLNSNLYSQYPYTTSDLTLARAQRVPVTPLTSVTASAFATANPAATSPPFFNADTFQILCAGRDETFGTDDDLSNFWPGTRKDYLDSLNQ
ncbi:MAG: prepilin-type N-terminal cleavage/methylation domain-containing protein [Planctomycetia bacterium]|nr:prepilin-type N-terminal cleavage/methylation domain-containing protein [Planctomycetia bacterium]